MSNEDPIGPLSPNGQPPQERSQPELHPQLRWNPYLDDPYYPDPYGPRI